MSVWLHQGRLRADVLWCVCSSTTLEGRRVYQWLQASRKTAHPDLAAAARQSHKSAETKTVRYQTKIIKQAQSTWNFHYRFINMRYNNADQFQSVLNERTLPTQGNVLNDFTLVLGCAKVRK